MGEDPFLTNNFTGKIILPLAFIVNPMLSWLQQLLRPSPAPPTSEPTLALQTELQNLRLELKERDQTITTLKQELDRQRQGEQTRLNQTLQSETEQLFREIASPISQILTQAHLLETEGKPVSPQDILTVAKRLIRSLEKKGLTLDGTLGETVPFDANYHQPLNSQQQITQETPVTIKIVGIAYQQKILKKALVERAE